MTCLLTEAWEHFHLGVREVLLEHLNADISLGLITDLVHVEVHNVSGYFLVKSLQSLISHDKNCIETRENR